MACCYASCVCQGRRTCCRMWLARQAAARYRRRVHALRVARLTRPRPAAAQTCAAAVKAAAGTEEARKHCALEASVG